ncbi:HDOD domain-containing protein [bacterium]|nr:HDOD domain-containing protein [bacterium]
MDSFFKSPVSSSSSGKRQEILQKLNTLDDLPTLPAAAQQVITLAQDPEVKFNDLKKVIITDPPLTAKVIRVANSALAGRRVPAETIDQALVTLGLDQLIAVANTVGVLNALDAWESLHLDRRLLWRHALATGFLAKSLEFRKMLDVKRGPDLFLSGLLHNIGWIVFDHLMPNMLAAALITASEINEWTLNIERDIMGMDHAEIGGIFLRKWEIPENICVVVENHHSPEDAEELSAFAGIIEISTAISPYKFPLDIGFYQIHESVPNLLKSRDRGPAMREMELRYAPNIKQAETMADMMLSWM